MICNNLLKKISILSQFTETNVAMHAVWYDLASYGCL